MFLASVSGSMGCQPVSLFQVIPISAFKFQLQCWKDMTGHNASIGNLTAGYKTEINSNAPTLEDYDMGSSKSL